MQLFQFRFFFDAIYRQYLYLRRSFRTNNENQKLDIDEKDFPFGSRIQFTWGRIIQVNYYQVGEWKSNFLLAHFGKILRNGTLLIYNVTRCAFWQHLKLSKREFRRNAGPEQDFPRFHPAFFGSWTQNLKSGPLRCLNFDNKIFR